MLLTAKIAKEVAKDAKACMFSGRNTFLGRWQWPVAWVLRFAQDDNLVRDGM